MKEKEFVKSAIDKIKAKDHIRNNLERAGIVNIDIRETTLGHRITIVSEKPGLIIGKKGRNIDKLRRDLEDLGLDKVEIEVEEVQERDLQPELICKWVNKMLLRGTRVNRAVKRAVRSIMDSGAMGAEVSVKGLTRGASSISTREKASAGYIKKAGEETKKVREADGEALLKQGKLGINVKIVPPNTHFRDKIKLEDYLKSRKKPKEEKKNKSKKESKDKKTKEKGKDDEDGDKKS